MHRVRREKGGRVPPLVFLTQSAEAIENERVAFLLPAKKRKRMQKSAREIKRSE
jgi:hypothetical protein